VRTLVPLVLMLPECRIQTKTRAADAGKRHRPFLVTWHGFSMYKSDVTVSNFICNLVNREYRCQSGDDLVAT